MITQTVQIVPYKGDRITVFPRSGVEGSKAASNLVPSRFLSNKKARAGIRSRAFFYEIHCQMIVNELADFFFVRGAAWNKSGLPRAFVSNVHFDKEIFRNPRYVIWREKLVTALGENAAIIYQKANLFLRYMYVVEFNSESFQVRRKQFVRKFVVTEIIGNIFQKGGVIALRHFLKNGGGQW